MEEVIRRLLRARDAMDRAYAKPLDVAILAKIACVSEAHFIRIFQATFGETPHRYLPRRARDVLAPLVRPPRYRRVLRRRLHQPRDVQPHLSRHRR